MKTIRWGILSTAKIAREWLIPALQESPYNEVVAIASRDGQKASDYAKQFGIPRSYDSYEALLADPQIDAIYNPMPNHLHVPFSMKALQAGKHVLCEKPLGLHSQEVQQLQQCAAQHPHLVMMEAFMYRFHPQWQRALKLIAEGELGDIKAVESSFTYFNRDQANVRNQSGIGGGGLMDIGCYCISAARTLFGREPIRVSAQLDIDPDFGVDRHASGLMDFGPGTATFYCSTQSAPNQYVKATGTKGVLTIENPFYRRDVPSRLLLRQENEDKEIVVGHFNHYVEQVNAFALAVLNNQKSPTPLTDALANMQVIDALFRAHASNQWEMVAG